MGQHQGVSVATTMDIAIIRDLLNNVATASQLLGRDKSLRDTLLERIAHLFPMQIGRLGRLQEWYKDLEETDIHHRHTSHLFGLYPGKEISASATPALFDAARRTLEMRGDEGTDWSKGWKINFWARLLDGDHAYKLILLFRSMGILPLRRVWLKCCFRAIRASWSCCPRCPAPGMRVL